MVTFAFKLVCLILFMAGTRSFRLISLVSTRSRSSRQVKRQTIGLDLLCANRFRPTRWTPQNFIESTLRICSFSEIIFLTFSLQFSSCSSFTPKKSKFQRLLYSSCFTSRVLFEFASFSTWLIRPLLSPYSFWVNSRESL